MARTVQGGMIRFMDNRKKISLPLWGTKQITSLPWAPVRRSAGYQQPRLIPPKQADCSSRIPSREGCLVQSGAPELACRS